jgi:hypothetical protein
MSQIATTSSPSANATTRSHPEGPYVEDIQRIFVDQHIAALTREAEAQRLARRAHDPNGSEGSARTADGPAVRVRVGRWLIGVGRALESSGSSIDSASGQAGRPA